MPRANSQPVRLDSQLIEKMEKLALASGRSIPMEIEYRLKRSLTSDPIERLPEWPRAVAYLTGLLARDAASSSQSPDEALAVVKESVSALLDILIQELRKASKNDKLGKLSADDRRWAADQAEFLARRLLDAHKQREDPAQTVEDLWQKAAEDELVRALSLPNAEQMRRLQAALLVTPEALKKIAEAASGKPGRR